MERRTNYVAIKMSDSEKALVKEKAEKMKMDMSNYIRWKIFNDGEDK